TPGEKIAVGSVEIVADDSDNLNGVEVAGGQSDIGARASQHPVNLAIRRLYTVISDGSDYNNGHYSIVLRGLPATMKSSHMGLRPHYLFDLLVGTAGVLTLVAYWLWSARLAASRNRIWVRFAISC